MRERKLNRLPGFDYSTPGAYFVTMNVKYQDRIFGKIENGEMILSEYGEIADQQWRWLFGYPYLGIDEYIIMPDHFHGIIHILPSYETESGIA